MGQKHWQKIMNDIKTKKRNRLGDVILDHLVFLAKTGWEILQDIPFRRVIKDFITVLKIKKNNMNKPVFNQKIHFKSKFQKQYDDQKNIINEETLYRCGNKRGKGKKKDNNNNNNNNIEQKEEATNNILCIPENINEKKDYIPKDWIDLIPKNTSVDVENHGDNAWICEHSWETVKGASVIECLGCNGLVCSICLDKQFNYKKRSINKLLKKTTAFNCPSCMINEITQAKDKKNGKRKRRRPNK